MGVGQDHPHFCLPCSCRSHPRPPPQLVLSLRALPPGREQRPPAAVPHQGVASVMTKAWRQPQLGSVPDCPQVLISLLGASNRHLPPQRRSCPPSAQGGLPCLLSVSLCASAAEAREGHGHRIKAQRSARTFQPSFGGSFQKHRWPGLFIQASVCCEPTVCWSPDPSRKAGVAIPASPTLGAANQGACWLPPRTPRPAPRFHSPRAARTRRRRTHPQRPGRNGSHSPPGRLWEVPPRPSP